MSNLLFYVKTVRSCRLKCNCGVVLMFWHALSLTNVLFLLQKLLYLESSAL